MNKVAVIGLGQMGAPLANLLLDAGWEVHVWNRSPEKASQLAHSGAHVAATAAEAVENAQFAVMCVYDHAAAASILAQPGVWRGLKGKTLLQLTTFSPQEAKGAVDAALDHGAAYLSGAIQVAPEQMGKPDTTILLSGPRATAEGAESLLKVFGGNIAWLGDSASAAPTMDLATLSFVYGATAGFLQGAALAQQQGLDVQRYGEIVRAMAPSYGDFLRHEANVIASGDFTISQSPLSISVPATRRIEHAMRDAGVRTELPAAIADLLEQSAAVGLADQELAAVVKVLKAG